MCNVIFEIIETTSCDEATEQMVDDFYLESQGIMNVVVL